MDLNLSSLRTVGYLSYFKREFICKLTVCVHNYSQVSALFENLEHIEGVKRVERMFWHRKLWFLTGCILTFGVWTAHPYILFYIKSNWVKGVDPLVSGAMLYSGIFMLFLIVYLLKSLTQRSFPEFRETNLLWAATLLLSAFALITLAAEVYFFELAFNWMILSFLVLLYFAYLMSEYLNFHEQS